MVVAVSQFDQCPRVILLGRLAQPFHRLAGVRHHPFAVGETGRQPVLGFGAAPFGFHPVGVELLARRIRLLGRGNVGPHLYGTEHDGDLRAFHRSAA
jgi:hypothetical protein